MPDETKSQVQDRTDRYFSDSLTPAEARALAQRSLDDPELFEQLTAGAQVKAALAESSIREQLKSPQSHSRVVQFPRRARVWIPAAIAAAAIVLAIFSSLRSSDGPLSTSNPPPVAAVSTVKPALAAAGIAGRPLLLAVNLQSKEVRQSEVFRGAESESRAPRQEGVIASIEGGQASIDLGSLDGIAKGSELQVFRRGEPTAPAVAGLKIVAVFRERARGGVPDGNSIRVNDRVRIADAAYLGALLDQADALASRGDSEAARTMAVNAVRVAAGDGVAPRDRRRASERLAALEYQAGALDAAEKLYQSVVNSLNSEPATSAGEQATALNDLAVLYLLRGDYAGAEPLLNQAFSRLPAAGSAYARAANNLGVLAELRGDTRTALQFYDDAAREFATAPDSTEKERQAADANLARLKTSR
jgi:tetratricopeptide (TPR) repeat protein